MPTAKRAAAKKTTRRTKALRENAGLTLGDRGQAINLKDTSLLAR